MSNVAETIPQDRFVSLDVFRGITIAGMVLVNNPGTWAHVYAPLEHSEWHGWTPTDLIFPFFVFIIGVAMAFSFSRRVAEGDDLKKLYPKVLTRTALILVVAYAMRLIPVSFPEGYNWFTDTFLPMRIPGVLERIALVYLFASMVVIHFKPRGQAIWALGFLAFYWIVMKVVPFTLMKDGVPVTYQGSLENEFNLAAYIDNMFLRGHTYRVGEYLHHDPEGILSTIPAISTALIGVLTGYWLKSGKEKFEIVAGLFFAGAVGLVIGEILNLGFPINKPLWSPSYVIFTGGMALCFLGFCYYLIDIKKQDGWIKPFVIFGMNPLALYVLSGFFARVMDAQHIKPWLFKHLFASWLSPFNASLGFALSYVLLWLGMMTIFYKKRIFIKL